MPKQTIAGLQREVASLMEGREKTNIALGLYRNANLEERLKKIEQLKKSERDEETERVNMIAEDRGYRKASESIKDEEIHWLRRLVRSLVGDKTLDRELEIETTGQEVPPEMIYGRAVRKYPRY